MPCKSWACWQLASLEVHPSSFSLATCQKLAGSSGPNLGSPSWLFPLGYSEPQVSLSAVVLLALKHCLALAELG